MKKYDIPFLASVVGSILISISLIGCGDDSQQAEQQTTVVAEPTTNTFKWTWLDNINGVVPFTNANDLLRKNYYVVIDGSGSMSGERMNTAKQATIAFTSKVDTSAALGLTAFDSRGTNEHVSLRHGNDAEFNAAVNDISAGGGTPLESAIKLAYSKLVTQAAKQKGYGEYHLIIVTDGNASMGQDPRDIVNDISANSPIEIHSIGFQFTGQHSLNQVGITTYYQADDYDGLMNSFTSILAESTNFDSTDFN